MQALLHFVEQALLVDIVVKATLVLAVALAVVQLLRRASAALRHAVLASALISVLLLPMASALLPRWRVAVLPSTGDRVVEYAVDAGAETTRETSGEVSHAPPSSSPAVQLATVETTTVESTAIESTTADAVAEQTNSLDYWQTLLMLAGPMLFGVWGFGAALLAARLAYGAWRTRRLYGNSRRLSTGVWVGLLDELRTVGLARRGVELREHDQPLVPLACGVFRPAVLLPEIAADWDAPTQRAVLLHELAHVARRDVAAQLLGRCACTLFWFHPLAWLALRQLRQESEQAADDVVMSSGTKASDYAERLLQVARLCCAPRGLAVSIAMAEQNNLERRVRALFDTRRSRRGIGRATLSLLLAAFAAAAGVVGAVELVSAAPAPLEVSSEEPEPSPQDDAKEEKAKADAKQREADLKSDGKKSDEKAKRPQEKFPLDQVVWWPADGIQYGFWLKSPAEPNQRVPMNSTAVYQVLVRNTTAAELRFVARLLPYDGRDAAYLIPTAHITKSLQMTPPPVKYRAIGVEPKFARRDPSYVIKLGPGESVVIPAKSGRDDLRLYVGEKLDPKSPSISNVIPGMNWIVHPLQFQRIERETLLGGVRLLGRYELTKISRDGKIRRVPASRMAATGEGKLLYPRIQLDVGTLAASAAPNAKHALWGKVDRGLQCGIRPLKPQTRFRTGDMIEAELLWRNVGATEIRTPLPRQLDLWAMIEDDEGVDRHIDFGARFIIYPTWSYLRPGEVHSLGVVRVKFTPKGTASPRTNAEPGHIMLKPGAYHLIGLGGVSAPRGGNPRSGRLPFEIVE